MARFDRTSWALSACGWCGVAALLALLGCQGPSEQESYTRVVKRTGTYGPVTTWQTHTVPGTVLCAYTSPAE